MKVRMRVLGALAAGALVLTGCGSDDDDNGSNGDTGQNGNGDLTVAVVTHGSAGDKFWDVVKTGAEQAGSDLGIEVTYQSSGDPNQQSQYIDSAISQQVDGIVVSMANPDALAESIKRAVAADIPVITINSGADRSAEFGAITHVGQTESVAGEAAGERLAAEGASKLVCVIHEAGNVGLEQRCAGAAATFGGEVENLQVNVSDLAAAEATVAAKLQSDGEVDAVLTLNNAVAMSAVAAAKTAGRDEVGIGTFDLDSDVLNAIKEGQLLFAIDQQQYLQGYLPVTFLSLYRSNANTVGGGQPVLTGPGFVDADNADLVAEYADKGTR